MNDINKLLDDYEHECFMLRVEATETRAKNDVVRMAYERIRDEFAERIAATLSRPKAKSHPYGYEPDTGAFDATRCECGCLNDISATYCNDCGGEIEVDINAEKEIYHMPRHSVFAEKHDDGSLEFAGKRYIAATLGVSNESVKTLIDDMLDFICNCCETTLDCDCCDPVDCKYIDGDGEFAECTRYQDFLSRAKAISATLGCGTCKLELATDMESIRCSACGYKLPKGTDLKATKFCGGCGCEVEQ